jgi:hypothetical protein
LRQAACYARRWRYGQLPPRCRQGGPFSLDDLLRGDGTQLDAPLVPIEAL